MPTITIKHRDTEAVLFTHEVTDEQQSSGLAMRATLEAACKDRADLGGADLRGAYLGGADLIDGGQDARGHRFYAWRDKEAAVVVYRAGCHEWTSINDALAWYGPSYPSDGDRTECIARLNLLHSETLRRWPAISNGSAEA